MKIGAPFLEQVPVARGGNVKGLEGDVPRVGEDNEPQDGSHHEEIDQGKNDDAGNVR